MTSFKNYSNEGIELVIDTNNGDVYATQRGLARMCGVAHTTIGRWKGGASVTTKTAEVLTPGGLQGGAELFDIKGISKAVAKYNPELAEQFMEIGATLVLQRSVNYIICKR